MLAFIMAIGMLAAEPSAPAIGPADFVRVHADGWNFEVTSTHERFIPFGSNLVFSYPSALNQGLDILVKDEWDTETIRNVFKAAHGLHMNVLKVFLPSDRVLPDPQPQTGAHIKDMTPPLFDRLDFVFQTARENGVYVSLTLAEWGMHSLKWWQDGGTFVERASTDPAHPTSYSVLRGFWQTLAQRYKNEPALFSYNLAVEFYMPGGNWGAQQNKEHDYLLNDRWALPAWREWLLRRYTTAAQMNAAWGTKYTTIDDTPQPEIVFADGAYSMSQSMIADYISFKECITYAFLKNEAKAIRSEDTRHMITCGFHPHQPGANWMGAARFTAGIACVELDFLDYCTTHHYSNPDDFSPGKGVPERAYRNAVLNARFMFAGKPVVIEEMGHVVKDAKETLDGTTEQLRRFVGHASGFMLWFLTDIPEEHIFGPLDTKLQPTDYGLAWRKLAEPGGVVYDLPKTRATAKTVVPLERTEGLAPTRQTMVQRLQDNWDSVPQPVDFTWPRNPAIVR
jgi:hypothetical protein